MRRGTRDDGDFARFVVWELGSVLGGQNLAVQQLEHLVRDVGHIDDTYGHEYAPEKVLTSIIRFDMPDFSVITCISDPTLYDRILLESAYLARGRHDVEFIPVLNVGGQYSAADACNIGIEVAHSDQLVIAHQDVRLLGDDWFAHLSLILSGLPEDWAILSAAGIASKYGHRDIGRWGGAVHVDTVAVGQVWDSDEALTKPPYWNGERSTQEIHAADECLMVLNRRHCLRFDARFSGFHFYGIDLCMQARAAGYKVYGGDLPIIHYGKHSASLVGDKKYWVYLRYLHNKWKFLFPELFATHMHWIGDDATSYISVSLESGDGPPTTVRAMTLGKTSLLGDYNWGIED